MDDPRFKHVAMDPRFKAIPRKARKVKIDSRFQSMFTDKKFKIKYAVDRRGRRVKQSSSEDLRKYYDIDEAEIPVKRRKIVEDETKGNLDGEHPVISDQENVKKGDIVGENGDFSADISSESDEESDAESSSSTDIDDFTFDLNVPGSKEIVHEWGEVARGGRVPHSDETSHRLAVCNMDWDRITANDIFVLINSFKPRGGSVLKVSIYPSDFGLERLAREEVEGPSEFVDCGSGDENEGPSDEGHTHSMEKLRSYQLNRLRYYYAVAECDSKATAEAIYEQCDGLEYERSGGQIDLRFIPDDVTFEDREAQSVATESNVPVNFTPSNFVNTALQQSKVEMTWDETDPKRLQTTMRKFTKEDIQSMDFGAYLASSSSDDSDSEEVELGGRGREAAVNEQERIQKYKDLLGDIQGDKDQSSAGEEMEITWEPGLKLTTKDILKKKTGGKSRVDETTWEKYLREKRQKKKKKKRSKMKEEGPGCEEADGNENEDVGFDEPFFQHDITTATAKSKKSKKSKPSQEEVEREQKKKSELELLMLEDDDKDSREHFHLNAIMKQEKESNKKRRRKQKRGSGGDDVTGLVDGFEIDLNDPRFSALYESHLYAPDPANPLYRSTKAMEAVMKERLKRSKHSSSSSNHKNSSQSSIEPSIVSLVKSVKSKSSSFKEKQKKRKSKDPSIQL